MPQASDALRNLMTKWFGSYDDAGPFKLLQSKGWTCHAGMWFPPTSSYYGPREDYILLKFLNNEWDYDFKTPPLMEGIE